MARSVSKSAKTGRFVSQRTARNHPRTTVRQTVGAKGGGYRSTITGRYVTKATVQRHPGTTIREG